MKSIQTFLEEFHCIPLEEKPMILLQASFKFFAIKHDQPENLNELFQKLLEDLKELAEYKESLENSSTKSECDVPISKNSPICDDHSEIFSDSKNDDDILSDNDDFKDIEYVKASLFNPEIVSLEEENVVHQEEENDVEEEEIDLEDISQIQDIVLREKLLSITR
nr:hypothetical protein [Tanacetum cinerariifolium]